ncbi:ribonuclease H-like domain-containing protein [Thalassorhabdus alkalitolerans]|uniref:Ribonuclease H-like domain-containing protein n=1 Tax=Thalassorhabdus alkalitolerans TaxID=2282697 RepID=A0ABW0YMZ3_9BACI
MGLKNKLKRMQSHLGAKEISSKDNQRSVFSREETDKEDKEKKEVSHREIWERFDTYPRFLDGEYMLLRKVVYPLSHFHGKYQFKELYDVFQQWKTTACEHPLNPSFMNPEELLFFDTETTGLSGGAGNTIFLLGTACVQKDQVTVKQYFLPGPEAEVALYHTFLSEVSSLDHLVTYNGKSFDWPQVKTRHTFVRNEVPKLPSFGHYDLLHGARRLFKHTLESCKLSQVEKEILQFKRLDDTPGYLAPMLYFDYLQEGHPEIIKGILTHNEWDVLSLISLYIDISKRIISKGTDQREALEVGRWHESTGNIDHAIQCFHKAEKFSKGENAEALYYLGKLYKKKKDLENAVYYFHKVEDRKGLFVSEASIELAKIYEHSRKDYEKALYYTWRSLEYWKERQRIVKSHKALGNKEEFTKRINRLEGKIKKR